MSYKVLGESLNLKYTSKNPLFTDPSGKIKNLLKQYQKTDDLDEEGQLIHSILAQMNHDAECVPLYYFALPTFVNNNVLDFSNVDIDESFQLWKLRLRD